MNENNSGAVLRIIDANLNRLREALRVIEEYFRFINGNEDVSIQLKLIRHSLEELDKEFDLENLLKSRDTDTDPFAEKNRKEELYRTDIISILTANFKRSQEAARVLEEYSKITNMSQLSEKAKSIRFTLYALEKKVMEKHLDE